MFNESRMIQAFNDNMFVINLILNTLDVTTKYSCGFKVNRMRYSKGLEFLWAVFAIFREPQILIVARPQIIAKFVANEYVLV